MSKQTNFNEWILKLNELMRDNEFKINPLPKSLDASALLNVVLYDYFPRAFDEIMKSDFYQRYSHFFKPIPVSALHSPAASSGLKKWLYSFGDILLYSLLCKPDGSYMITQPDVVAGLLTDDNVRRISQVRSLAYVLAYAYIFLDETEQERFHDLFYMIPPNRIWQYNVSSWIFIITSIARMKADFDNVIVVTGYEGSGKSTFVKSLMYLYRYIVFGQKPQNENIILNVEDYAQSLITFKNIHGEVFHLDEAGTMLFSRDAGTNFSKLQIKILEVARERNWFFFVVIPNINWLDKYVRTHRIAGWLDISSRGAANYYGRNVLLNSPDFLKSNLNIQTNSFEWNKMKRKALFLTVPNFDFDDEVLTTYNEKKKIHVDKTIDEFVNYVALMTQNSNLTSHTTGSTSTGFPQQFFILNHFPKLVCLNDAAGITGVQNPKYNKNLLRELVKSGDLYPATDDGVFGLTYFQNDDKNNPITRVFGIGMDMWKQYLQSIKKSNRNNFAGDFGFNVFRRYLYGVFYSYAANKLSDTMSYSFFYEKYALYLLKSFMNLNSLFEAYLFVHAQLDEKTLVMLQSRIQEASLVSLHNLFYDVFLSNISYQQIKRALKGLFSMAIVEYSFVKEKSFSEVLLDYFGNMNSFNLYSPLDVDTGKVMDRLQGLAEKYVELLNEKGSLKSKGRQLLVDLVGANEELDFEDELNRLIENESIKKKLYEINGSIDKQESTVASIERQYEDYVDAIVNKLAEIKKAREQAKSKPEPKVVEVSKKSKEEELLDELKEVFG